MKKLILVFIILCLVFPVVAISVPIVMEDTVNSFDRDGVMRSFFFLGSESWILYQHEFDAGIYFDTTLSIETTPLSCPIFNYYVAAIVFEDEVQWEIGKAGTPLEMNINPMFLEDGKMEVYVRGFLGKFEINESVLSGYQEKDPIAPVPEPATLILFGIALITLPFFMRRKLIKEEN